MVSPTVEKWLNKASKYGIWFLKTVGETWEYDPDSILNEIYQIPNPRVWRQPCEIKNFTFAFINKNLSKCE